MCLVSIKLDYIDRLCCDMLSMDIELAILGRP